MQKKESEEQLERLLALKRETPDVSGAYEGPVPSGVSANWLAQVFRMHPNTVREKLRHCPIKSDRQRGTKMRSIRYDLPTAAAYLITPQLTTTEYLRGLKRGDLPPALQQTVWDALLKRQRWEENAGQLWRTEKIRQVLGGTFQTIKFTMQLWVDTLERQMSVTPEQRRLIVEMVDNLQGEIYDALVKEAEEAATGSQLQELPELVGEADSVFDAMAKIQQEDPEDQEIEDLI